MLLILAIHYGSVIAADPYWAKIFTLEAPTLAIVMMAYGFIASVLPVWFYLLQEIIFQLFENRCYCGNGCSYCFGCS